MQPLKRMFLKSLLLFASCSILYTPSIHNMSHEPVWKNPSSSPLEDATLRPLPGWGSELCSPHQASLSTALPITLQTRSGPVESHTLTPPLADLYLVPGWESGMISSLFPSFGEYVHSCYLDT